MKTGDFLNKLATKSGIDKADKALIDLLSKSEFANMEIPDELANKIDSSLMDLEAAKANPEIRKIIKGETLNGADSMITKLITELGFTDDEVSDVIADKNTFTKIEKLVKKTSELATKKAGAKPADKEAIQKQLDDLNGQIRTAKEAHTNEVKSIKATHETELTNFELINMISDKKLALPAEMPAKVKNDIVLNAIKSELAAKGLQIVNENGIRSVKKADGTDAYDEGNRKIALTGLIDGVLAQNKLLAVTTEPVTPPVVPPIPGGPTTPIINQGALSAIDQAIKDAGGVPQTT